MEPHDGETHAWLASALQEEREEVGRRHAAILAQLQARLVGRSCAAAGCGLPGQVDSEPGLWEVDGGRARDRDFPNEPATVVHGDALRLSALPSACSPTGARPAAPGGWGPGGAPSSASSPTGSRPAAPGGGLGLKQQDTPQPQPALTDSRNSLDTFQTSAESEEVISSDDEWGFNWFPWRQSGRTRSAAAKGENEKGYSILVLIGKVVAHPSFELFFALVITFNTLFMVLMAQRQGLILGREQKIDGLGDGDSNVWPGADIAFEVFGYLFGVLFTVELVLRVTALGRDFFKDVWNYFDGAIVFFWVVEEVFDSITLPVDAFLLRVFRLMRLLRVLRLVRKLRGFESLYLMMTAMRGSFSMLAWTLVILVLVQVFFALALNQLIELLYLSDDRHDVAHRAEVYKYFGTFSRALLSCFEMTLGNWILIARLLVENVSEALTIFSLLHKVVVGYGMIGIINGVFIQETFKVAATDDLLMMQRKSQASRMHKAKMKSLFQVASKGDKISLKRFRKVVKDEEVSQWLSAMEFDVRDNVDQVFDLLNTNNDAQVSLEELSFGVSRLKGSARSLDLALFAKRQEDIDGKLSFLLKQAGASAV